MRLVGTLTVMPITEENDSVFYRLVQCYEAEFSSITQKVPDKDGVFPLDTHLDHCHVGYLLYFEGTPAGFNIIALKGDDNFEVSEFYILPVFRKQRLGYELAVDGFNRHPGAWEVKQIAGADDATRFWRRAIGKYTDGRYVEDAYNDAYWGAVTRQRFMSVNALKNCEQPGIDSGLQAIPS